ncbi:MAG: hypothetical protein GXP48_11755, partial [Acidobacteria bacterium]|nr:hypothetical protein [Acidobacteriota bacterium]
MKVRSVWLLVIFSLFCVLTFAGTTPRPGDTASVGAIREAVQQAASVADTVPAGSGSWVGDVFVLPFTYGGPYTPYVNGQLNVLPREWVAKSFYGSNPDSYDFLLVLTQFDMSGEDGIAGFYWAIRNDVNGIGISPLDVSAEFGSTILQGMIDGGALAQYIREDGSLDSDRAAVILNHEIGHRWLAYCRFRDAAGKLSGALLGRDEAHWSYLLDSDASFMYGSDWSDNGDGTYTATGVESRFSNLDLYLMGFLKPEDVAPLTLLVNPNVRADALPVLGDTISAVPSTVSVEQIIAAEGPREPASDVAPRSFRIGVIYLVQPGSKVTGDQLDAIEALSASWRRSFFRHTHGQAVIDVGRGAQPPVSSQDVNLNAAVAWLEAAASGGVWADSPATGVRDTADAITALARFASAGSYVSTGLDGLAGQQPSSTELLARQVAVLARNGRGEAAAILGSRLADAAAPGGGWGAYARYTPDMVTTARGLGALHAAGTDPDLEAKAWTWVRAQQRPDGAWGWRPSGTSALYPTEEVLLAAADSVPDAAAQPFVQKALSWLVGRQESGGFGEPYPDIVQTALFLRLGLELGVDRAVLDNAIAFLAKRQGEDGSWDGSVAKTAAAVTALAPFYMPDPGVNAAEIVVHPKSPFEGDELTLSAAVRNFGGDLTDGCPYRWELADAADPSRVLAELPGTLPAISAGGWSAVNESWQPSVPAGQYLLRLVLDPDLEWNDASRVNNTAAVPLTISAHPEGVDLAISSQGVMVSPSVVKRVPQPTTVSLTIKNLGLTDATGANIAVFDGPTDAGQQLGLVTVDVPSLGSAVIQIPVTLTEARAYTLTVVADPKNLLHDENRYDNAATKSLPVEPTFDPAVVNGSFTVDPAEVTAGDTVTLSATIRNGGTRELGAVQVAFTYQAGTPPVSYPISLEETTGPLEPGESQIVHTEWQTSATGSPLTLTVEVDPYGAVDDEDRSNNTAAAQLTVAPGTLPDLVVSPSDLVFDPQPVNQGDAVTVTGTVTNGGNVAAGPFAAEIRLDDPQSGPIIASTNLSGLEPGASATVTGSWTADSPTDHLVYLIADPGNTVEELNEANNQAFRVLNVRSRPDLVLTRGSILAQPGFPHTGEPVHFTINVENVGEQGSPGTVVEVRDDSGALLGTAPLSAIPAHGRGVATFDWQTPATPGEAVLSFDVNPSHTVVEQRYDNNRASRTMAVQDTSFYLSDRFISPNGDGVKDTVTVFFRNPLESVTVADARGKRVRVLPVPDGAASVTWDGTADDGSVVADGVYVLHAGAYSASVVVDANRIPLTDSPSGVQLQWTLSSSSNDWYDFGLQLVTSPADGALYFLKDRPNLPSRLMRFAWGKLDEVGDWPSGVSNPDYVTSHGDLFLTVDSGVGLTLVHYPGAVVESRPWRSGFSDASLTPDGRWIVWTTGLGQSAQLLFESVADPSVTRSFGPFGNPGDVLCRMLGPFWAPDGSRGVVIPLFSSSSSEASRLYLLIDLANEPTVKAVVPEAGKWPECSPGYVAVHSESQSTSSGEMSVDFLGGRLLFFSSGGLTSYDLDSGALLSETDVPIPADGTIAEFGLANNGRGMVFNTWESGELAEWLENCATGESGRISLPPGSWNDVRWSALDRFLYWHGQYGEGDAVVAIATGENLTVDLKPHILFGNAGISLSLVATDRHLDRYVLEYAPADAPGQLQQLGQPGTEPILGKTWGTWLPPAKGRYLIRLTATDLAGNRRSVTKTVFWDGDNDIANLALDQRYISPLASPGVKDSLVFRYVVLRPANLLFEIKDASGRVVRRLPVAADQLGERVTTWDGIDETGHPVPDGRYTLCYLGAVWPFVVDNTPPQLELKIDTTTLKPSKTAKNGLTNLIHGSVQDVNPGAWTFAVREGGTGEWVALADGVGKLAAEKFPLPAVAAGFLPNRELRLVATDRAGNTTEAVRVKREELLAVAASEPLCQTAAGRRERCSYDERPPVTELIDRGQPLAVEDGARLQLLPDYTALMVQSTVWGDARSALRLEYRRAGSNGLPPGSWQAGQINVGQRNRSRLVEFKESVLVDGEEKAVPRSVEVGLIPVYWNHRDLPAGAYEIRLLATDQDGQNVTSPVLRLVPPQPLLLEALGTDEDGFHFRVTNVGAYALHDVSLQRSLDGGKTWFDGGPLASALRPGESTTHSLKCALFMPAPLLRAVSRTESAFANSNTILAPVFHTATLKPDFQAADCRLGRTEPMGLRFVNIGMGPVFGEAPAYTDGRLVHISVTVPPDPAGTPIEAYELTVDGVVVATLNHPPAGSSRQLTLDLSSFAEGSHTLSERYRYPAGVLGILGACPRSSQLVIDRTPPTVRILAPADGATLCPKDGVVHVQIEKSADVVSSQLFLDGKPLSNLEFDAGGLKPGPHTLTVEVNDGAGWSACDKIQVFLDELPGPLELQAQPLLFSPSIPDGYPAQISISSHADVPGTYVAEIRSLATGDVVSTATGEATRGEDVDLAWDGLDTQGTPAPDGLYGVTFRLTTKCGATSEAKLPDQQYEPYPIELDATPPDVTLTSPQGGEQVGAVLEIRGHVADRNLEGWQVEVRRAGDCDDCWKVVASGTSPAQGVDDPIASWETAPFEPGSYLLRLVATDGAGNATTAGPVSLTVRERKLIKRFLAAPTLISPNGDGRLDVSSVEISLIQDAVITLTVRDADDKVIRTLIDHETFPGGPVDAPAWDGTDDSGSVVSSGVYHLKLVAEDTASPPVLSPEAESMTVVVDLDPPLLKIQQPGESSVSGLPLPVIISASDSHFLQYALTLLSPAGPEVTLRSGAHPLAAEQAALLDGLDDGAYRLQLTASDRAGNEAKLVRSFVVDDSAPSLAWLKPTSGAVLDQHMGLIALRARIEEKHLAWYHVEAAPGHDPSQSSFTAIASGTQLPAGGVVEAQWDADTLPDGPYTLRIVAASVVGRVSEARVPVLLDGTPPQVTISAPADGTNVDSPVDIVGAASDENLVSWRLTARRQDDATVLRLASGRQPVTGQLATLDPLPSDGQYTLTLAADDAAGHEATAKVTLTVAAIPMPPVGLAATLAGRNDVQLTWAAGGGTAPSGYVVYRDGAPLSGMPVPAPPVTDTGVPDGRHTYVVRALNAFGAQSADSNSAEITVDTTPAVAQIALPASGELVSGQVEVWGTAYRKSGFASYTLSARSLPDGAAATVSASTAGVVAGRLGSWGTVGLADGQYELRLEARDVWGERATDTVHVTVDNTPPPAPTLTEASASAQDGDSLVNDVHVAWTLDPAPSDLAGFYLYRNGRLANAPGIVVGDQTAYLLSGTEFDDRNLPDGRYVYTVTAADVAGNESPESNPSAEIVIDTRRPHAVIVAPVNGAKVGPDVNVTADVEDNDVISLVFQYRLQGDLAWTAIGDPLAAPPFVTMFSPPAPGTYELRAVASDAGGADGAPEAITVTAGVLSPKPEAHVDGDTVTLTWPALDHGGWAQGIRVYRNGVAITPTPLGPDETTFTDSGLADGTYAYTLTVVDVNGGESDPSTAASAVVYTPILAYTEPIVELGVATISGLGVGDGDLVQLERRDSSGTFQVVAQTKASSGGSGSQGELDGEFVFAGVKLDPGVNVFRVRAATSAGDRSRPSVELALVFPPQPAEPHDLTADVSGQDVTLSWVASGSGERSGFRIERDDSVVLGESTTAFAYDPGSHALAASGGDPSEWQAVVDGDPTTGWTAQPSPSRATPAFWEWTWPDPIEGRQITVTWQQAVARLAYDVDLKVNGVWLWWKSGPIWGSTDTIPLPAGLRVGGVRLRLSSQAFCSGGGSCTPVLEEVGLLAATRPLASSFVDSGVPSGVHEYAVSELSPWGLESRAATVHALVGVEPPPAPEGLTASVGPGCRQISLSWTPVDPSPGHLLAYQVLRSKAAAGPYAPVAETLPSSTTYVDRFLAAGDTYWYIVRAVVLLDGMRVESSDSAPASAAITCASIPAPVIEQPTTAGHPVTLPPGVTAVAGVAWPGAKITLVADGVPIGDTSADPAEVVADAFDLPGFDPDSSPLT